MKMINLGGYGGCSLTQVLRKFKFNTEAFPFDWNITNQQFVINCINSAGGYFFDFDNDKYLFDTNILMSPNNDAFCIHDFVNWPVQKNEVKSKYIRRLNRLINYIHSNEDILFCRHVLDVDPYNDYHKSSWKRIPFNVNYDDINKWKDFLNNLNRNATTKLVLITNNPTMESNHPDILVCKQIDNYNNWDKTTFDFINNLIEY